VREEGAPIYGQVIQLPPEAKAEGKGEGQKEKKILSDPWWEKKQRRERENKSQA